MHRSIIRLAIPRPPIPPIPRLMALSLRASHMPPGTAFASTTSSPKDAENTSAQSGGSYSKNAKEATRKDTGSAGIDDTLEERDARGRTGGGEPLESSEHPPPPPKIWNAAVPPERDDMTDEQKEEVDRHNKEFDEKHDRAFPADDDKVDKNFWSPGTEKSVKK